MKKTLFTNLVSLVFCVVLIAAVALTTTACGDNAENTSSITASDVVADKSFTFKVTNLEGKETSYEIKSSKETVGEALIDEGLIEGEEGEYGLYVKTVNGITLDYEKDGKYWAFYVDGKYAQNSVDATAITQGATYSFKAE